MTKRRGAKGGSAGGGEPETILTSFGFTDLESRLYYELLRNAPATGYRLSQEIGKAPANIYQALRTLMQKGAVFISTDEHETKNYRPTPPDELLAGLQRSFADRHDDALKTLTAVQRPNSQEKLYELPSVTQVLERARSMLARSTRIVLFDFFPEIYDLLREDVDAVRARGVAVYGIAYRREDAMDGMPFNTESTNFISTRWPGLGLIIVKDGEEQLVAQLSHDQETVLNGIWSDSVFMSCIFHSAFASDIRLIALLSDPGDPLKRLSLQNSLPPGFETLLEMGSRLSPAP